MESLLPGSGVLLSKKSPLHTSQHRQIHGHLSGGQKEHRGSITKQCDNAYDSREDPGVMGRWDGLHVKQSERAHGLRRREQGTAEPANDVCARQTKPGPAGRDGSPSSLDPSALQRTAMQ